VGVALPAVVKVEAVADLEAEWCLKVVAEMAEAA